MKIEEIETLWAAQREPATQGDPAALRGQIDREIRHHRWFRFFLVATVLFGIVASQVLFYVNGQYAASYNSPLHFLNLVLNQIINVTVLYCLLRSLRRYRDMLNRRGETMQAVIGTALANVESEMADYRSGYGFVLFGLVTAGIGIYANFPGQWLQIAPRYAFILGLVGVIGLAIWQRYRKHLVPEHDRLRQTLEQLRG